MKYIIEISELISPVPFYFILIWLLAGVGGGGGMNWEIGIDIYTLICIK